MYITAGDDDDDDDDGDDDDDDDDDDDLSQGDLGAPVVCKMDEVWKVAGIVSHTRHCHNDAAHQEPQPTRFLSLQHYLPFVQKRGHFKDIGPLTALS